MLLFLSQEDLYRNSVEVEVLPKPVLQEALVRLPDVLWKVTEERE